MFTRKKTHMNMGLSGIQHNGSLRTLNSAKLRLRKFFLKPFADRSIRWNGAPPKLSNPSLYVLFVCQGPDASDEARETFSHRRLFLGWGRHIELHSRNRKSWHHTQCERL